MGLVVFDPDDAENLVAGHYSAGRGPVLRSDMIELTKVSFAAGEGAETHHHPEEQILFVLEGVLEMTLGTETYEVHAGQASFHPSDVPHGAVAKEDTVALSFKNLVRPNYDKTGQLT